MTLQSCWNVCYYDGEGSEIFLFSNLKPAAFEDVYLPPVESEAIGGRILNINKLHNIEKLVNTNQ